MAHFSKFIRPGAVRIGIAVSDKDLQATAAQNPDGSIAVVIFNEGKASKSFNLKINSTSKKVSIDPQAIQTIIVNN